MNKKLAIIRLHWRLWMRFSELIRQLNSLHFVLKSHLRSKKSHIFSGQSEYNEVFGVYTLHARNKLQSVSFSLFLISFFYSYQVLQFYSLGE